MANEKSLLLVRMDKIGDLVLALPVDQSPTLKGWKTTWLVTKGLGFVVDHSEPKRNFFESPKTFSLSAFFALVKKLKALNPDLAVVLYAPWWIGPALWLARVPRRFSRRSQWHSWLFFNGGLRQSRKSGDRHETEFNLELVTASLLPANASRELPAALKLVATEKNVEKWGLIARSYFVVHPGMAGSALNWPNDRWVELVRTLSETCPVVITGTASDRAYTEPLKQALGDSPKNVKWLTETLNSTELLTLLSLAKGVVAPSTGVLHLAASLGAPSVGIYSPIAVQRPTRWGPRGPQVRTLMPHVDSRMTEEEAKASMSSISAQQVIDQLKSVGAF